jgi:hypothetical protein
VFACLSRKPVDLVKVDYHQTREVRELEWIQSRIVTMQLGKFSQTQSTELVFATFDGRW